MCLAPELRAFKLFFREGISAKGHDQQTAPIQQKVSAENW